MWSHSNLVFFVNGKKVVDEEPDPEWTLLYYLRNKLRLCGTKLGCAEGGCGACTVMVSRFDRRRGKVLHYPVNACLAPVCSMHGLAVTTVEGIGSTVTKLHPVQERIAKAHGSQCGFCTPGIVMSMYSLLRSTPRPRTVDFEKSFQGNLCRCTGYRPIVEAYKTFVEDWEVGRSNGIGGCGMGDRCCKVGSNGMDGQCCKVTQDREGTVLFETGDFTPYESSQEPIFPPELKLSANLDEENLRFVGKHVKWYRPTTLAELVALKSKYPHAKIVVGNTEVGVEVKFKGCNYPVLIQPTLIPELIECTVVDDGIVVGAAVTLAELEEVLLETLEKLPEEKTGVISGLVEMLHYFAGKQIRSVASIGGNIMTGSPISDLNPVFVAAEVELVFAGSSGQRTLKMDRDFFTGYRKNVAAEDEVLVSVKVPYTGRGRHFVVHKQARRRDDDIAIVNAAFDVVLDDGRRVVDLRMAFGGMGPTVVTAERTRRALHGAQWDDALLEKATGLLLEELELPGDAPGGMTLYRKTLPASFLLKTYTSISKKLNIHLEPRIASAANKFTYKTPKSSQLFQLADPNQTHPVGQPVVHASAYKQASGEAVYFDDLPRFENELYMAFVYSTKAHAKIRSVNYTSALALDGVVGYVSADDVKPGVLLGPVLQDEEVFITKIVTSCYQLIGAILAEDQLVARRAAKLVTVVYEELSPVIVSIDDAIAQNSFFPVERKLQIGDVDKAFEKAKNVVEGESRIGYQEHFYLETHGALVVPKEEELEIFSSTQHPAEITDFVSRFLEVPQNRIATRVKRIGGGFGGKQSKGAPIAVAASIAAMKFRRPVRVMLDRDEDMTATGGRHPYLVKYRAAFEDDGTITAYESHVFANGGYSHDLSIEVLERAVLHIENAYKIPNLRVTGKICKTNLPSNTAFRGFGAPQCMLAAENMIRDVAERLGLDSVHVAKKNLYKEGDVTHYNQEVVGCNLGRCLDECIAASSYWERKAEIEEYNRNNRWKKRGISAVCTKYGAGFGVPFLEQAGALINIYTDGSVLLTHTGIEMGQGLHTKMLQVASRALEIPIERIFTSEIATDKVPNSSPSAASLGSDLNGMAVLLACNIINERLEPIKKKNPNGTWDAWVKDAYFSRVNLSAVAHYGTPDIEYNWETNTGKPYNYYTFGASCTEVEIDCLTGDHQVLRTDIVMDLGCSLNPAIDIGQIEGAFVQGYGLYVMEEMLYSPQGAILSKGPGTYKIPGFTDIPIEFNVSLLKGSTNPRAVFSSKAVGEPPLFLASSSFFAIREAIMAAREDAGVPKYFRLNAPATAEKIRMSCEDHLTKKAHKTKDDRPSWNVVP